jgi:hypothetical protein
MARDTTQTADRSQVSCLVVITKSPSAEDCHPARAVEQFMSVPRRSVVRWEAKLPRMQMSFAAWAKETGHRPARRASSHTACVGRLDLASVSPSLHSVSNSVRQTAASVLANLCQKPHLIARRAVHHCAPLQIGAQPIRAGQALRRKTIQQTQSVPGQTPSKAVTDDKLSAPRVR